MSLLSSPYLEKESICSVTCSLNVRISVRFLWGGTGGEGTFLSVVTAYGNRNPGRDSHSVREPTRIN